MIGNASQLRRLAAVWLLLWAIAVHALRPVDFDVDLEPGRGAPFSAYSRDVLLSVGLGRLTAQIVERADPERPANHLLALIAPDTAAGLRPGQLGADDCALLHQPASLLNGEAGFCSYLARAPPRR